MLSPQETQERVSRSSVVLIHLPSRPPFLTVVFRGLLERATTGDDYHGPETASAFAFSESENTVLDTLYPGRNIGMRSGCPTPDRTSASDILSDRRNAVRQYQHSKPCP